MNNKKKFSNPRKMILLVPDMAIKCIAFKEHREEIVLYGKEVWVIFTVKKGCEEYLSSGLDVKLFSLLFIW